MTEVTNAYVPYTCSFHRDQQGIPDFEMIQIKRLSIKLRILYLGVEQTFD